MRQIKFRAWHINDKEMLGHKDACLIPLFTPSFRYRDGETVLMQFTGLTDKNGVEVYEGDILEEDNQLFSVVFDSTWARFKLQHDRVIQNPEWNRGVKMLIVGNIHQNTELLEGDK